MPTFTPKKITDVMSTAITAIVNQWRGFERAVGGVRRLGAHRRGRMLGEQLQAAEEKIAAERHQRVRQQVRDVGLHLRARSSRCAPSAR